MCWGPTSGSIPLLGAILCLAALWCGDCSDVILSSAMLSPAISPARRNNNSSSVLIRVQNPPARFGVAIDADPALLLSRIDLEEEGKPPYRGDADGSELNVDAGGAPGWLCVTRGGAGGYEMGACKQRAALLGLRVEKGGEQVAAMEAATFLLFGTDLAPRTEVAFTTSPKRRGDRCDDLPIARVLRLGEEHLVEAGVVRLEVALPEGTYFLCLREPDLKESHWVHQGGDPWLSVTSVGRLLPIGLQAAIIGVLLVLSGLFSGLNLGLMALECTELKVLQQCGSEAEKRHARRIYPVRSKSNYLLCSLLLGNVLVNNTLTILLDDLTSGVAAIALSTFGIVVFGEIIPQAVCSRHGLAIGARTLWLTKLFMLLTFPLSYPISKVLDCVLGEEIRNVYSRGRLMELIRLTRDQNDLLNEEVDIISGALQLARKTVRDVMTPLADVFMVPLDAVLDFETVSEVTRRGFSRVPVYEGDRQNVVALLHVKDLAFVDPDTGTPLRTLCEFYDRPVHFVFEDTTLDVALNEFKAGRSHLAFVRCVRSDGSGDPFYELLGIVTLEDVIEEIIGSEIIDETDAPPPGGGRRGAAADRRRDFSDFARLGKTAARVSPQLALATYQFLATSLEPFRRLSESVLRRLMAQDVFFRAKVGEALYEKGRPSDCFVLLLEGRCQVLAGAEDLKLEAGPFSHFGLPALEMPGGELSPGRSLPPLQTFVPDYSVVAEGDTLYLKVPYEVYLCAFKATAMERQRRTETDSGGSSRLPSSRNSRSSLEIQEEAV